MESRILELYCRNVVLVEKDRIGEALKAFNSFDSNFLFTLDKFQNEDVE